MKRDRTTWLMILVGVAALMVVGWIGMRVQRTLAPASEYAPSVDEGSRGVPELAREVVLDGLSNVWDVGFLPDETLIFTERAGIISKVSGGRKVPLLNVPNIYARGEGGLLGLTVDPDFANNRFIYACYDTPKDIRLSRWRLNDDATALSQQTDIITGLAIKDAPSRHSGCRPRWGADGYLWIGTGDVAVGSNPQDPKSLAGKILRTDRDGKPAPGNLGSPFDPRIHSYGHRNVQGLAMLPAPRYGVYGFSVEHGPTREDELNPLVKGNMGWNPVPAYNESVPMTDTAKYPDAIKPVWTSGDNTIAPSGMTFLTGSKWRDLEGSLAMAVLKNQHLRILELDDAGQLKSQSVLFLEEFGRLRSAVLGPHDNLYLTTDNGDGQDKIIRISPK